VWGVKHLPKHLRPRWRYLAVRLEARADADVARGAFQRELWFAAANLLGDPGSADADLRVFSFSFAAGAGEAVVRVRRGEVGPARAAVACVTGVDGASVAASVIGVSGTVRACEEKYMRGPPEAYDEKRVVFRDSDSRALCRDGLCDVRTDGRWTGATSLDME
jgi:ribonuclease P/MRP protein subunit POP5